MGKQQPCMHKRKRRLPLAGERFSRLRAAVPLWLQELDAEYLDLYMRYRSQGPAALEILASDRVFRDSQRIR